MKQPFEYVLLDLGVVLLHLNYDSAIKQVAPLCDPARLEGGQSFLKLLGRNPIVDRYERGEISGRQFYDHFVSETGFTGNFDKFVEIWRSIFEENIPMLEFGAHLAENFPVYFLTNASDLHVPWVFDRFPRLRFFDDWACSCYLGETKPSREFYRKALDRLQLDPAKCLFLDDRPENVAGAEAFGISSILYTDPTDAVSKVRKALNFLEPDARV